MKGYDLQEGIYEERYLSEDELWSTMNWLFSTRSKNDSSYKFIFFKSILDNINNVDEDYIIGFDKLFERFTEIAWNLVLKYRIRQKAVTKGKIGTYLEQVLDSYSQENNFVPYNELVDFKKKRICKLVKSKCKKYVVGALYGDTNRLLYSFSKKEEWIKCNPQMHKFISKNQVIIENLNYFKWAKFYEGINEDSLRDKLASLINDNYVRKNESAYRGVLAYEFERTDLKVECQYNTLELLFMAEEHLIQEKDESKKEVLNDEIESKLFEDFDTMRTYLTEPIQLINKLKKERGILR